MCLSNVYLVREQQEKELLCKNIASVLSDGNRLTFTNLLGIPTVMDGQIIRIDLVDNCIYVRPQTEKSI